MKEAELCFPQLLNDSCRIPETPNFSFLCLYFVLFFVSLVTAALNMLVFISISHFRHVTLLSIFNVSVCCWFIPVFVCETDFSSCRCRQLHTPTNILLLSLAVSDLLVGILVMPFEIILKETCWILGDFMCVLYFLVSVITISSSVGNMVLISIDRYVAICDPLHYPRKVTLRRASLCVSVCWGSAALYAVILLYENLMEPGRYISCRGECFVNISGTVDLVVSFVVPILVIVVLYTRVFMVAASQARAVKLQTERLKTVKAKKSEMKAAVTLGILVVVFLLCYSPYYCVSLSGHEILVGSYSEVFMIFLMYFNSCLNPVIYSFFYPWFRKAMRLILTGQILRPGSREVRVL